MNDLADLAGFFCLLPSSKARGKSLRSSSNAGTNTAIVSSFAANSSALEGAAWMLRLLRQSLHLRSHTGPTPQLRQPHAPAACDELQAIERTFKVNAALAGKVILTSSRMQHAARRWQRLVPGLAPRISSHADYGREAIVANPFLLSPTWRDSGQMYERKPKARTREARLPTPSRPPLKARCRKRSQSVRRERCNGAAWTTTTAPTQARARLGAPVPPRFAHLKCGVRQGSRNVSAGGIVG